MNQEFQNIIDECIELCDEWLDNKGKKITANAGILTLLDNDGVYRVYTVKQVIFQWDSDCKVDLSLLWEEEYIPVFHLQPSPKGNKLIVSKRKNKLPIPSIISKPKHSFSLFQLKSLCKKGKIKVRNRADGGTNLEALGLDEPARFNDVIQDLRETDFVGTVKKIISISTQLIFTRRIIGWDVRVLI